MFFINFALRKPQRAADETTSVSVCGFKVTNIVPNFNAVWRFLGIFYSLMAQKAVFRAIFSL